MRRILTPEQVAKACLRYQQGEPAKTIAQDLGAHQITVIRAMRKQGIQIRIGAPPPKLSTEQENELCRRFELGESNRALCKAFSLTPESVRNILTRHGVERGPVHKLLELPLPQREEIVRRYLHGESSLTLAEDFNVNSTSIRKFLESQDVPRRRAGTYRDSEEKKAKLAASKRIYKCNYSFFHRIESETQAYWLGFLAADGCVSAGALSVALSRSDREHLVKLQNALQSTHPVKDITQYPNQEFIKKPSIEMSVLVIRSREMSIDLIRHGVVPQKTFLLQWPTFLPDELLRHYTRGYFDGDGSCTVRRQGKNGAYPNIEFSVISNHLFLTGMQDFLVRTCQLNLTKLKELPTRRKETKILRYGGNRQVARIAHLLYDGASIYLERKFEKIKHLLN